MTEPWLEAPRSLLRRSERLAPGVLFADGTDIDFSRARMALLDDDYVVRVIDGADLQTGSAAQSAIVSALNLPISAATNLDALVDALRDLDLWWPRNERIALLWRDADVLRAADPGGFRELVDILTTAHAELWTSPKHAAEPGHTRKPFAAGAAQPSSPAPSHDTAQDAPQDRDRVLTVVLLPTHTSTAPLDPTAPEIQ